jgi:hypothetical protein
VKEGFYRALMAGLKAGRGGRRGKRLTLALAVQNRGGEGLTGGRDNPDKRARSVNRRREGRWRGRLLGCDGPREGC